MGDDHRRIHRFEDDRLRSEGFATVDALGDILAVSIPLCTNIKKATRKEDRDGTDFWAERVGLPSLSIDLKAANRPDYSVHLSPYKRRDDLALETWSLVPKTSRDCPNGKVGWSRDPNKRTDYICWYWPDTRRFCIVPFPPLCQIFSRDWQNWTKANSKYVKRQPNGAYESECVFVLRSVVFNALTRWSCGFEPDPWDADAARRASGATP